MLFVCECFHVTTLLYALQNSATDPPYHPTVSDISSLTEKVLEFVGYHLQPLPINLSSYLKDTTDLWNKLKVIQNADENDWFVTLDESSLPLRHLCRGLIYNALEALYSQQNTTIYTFWSDYFHRVHSTHNCFPFENDYYLQLQGMAMGIPLSPRPTYSWFWTGFSLQQPFHTSH